MSKLASHQFLTINRMLILLAISALAVSTASAAQATASINVTLYYETLCPDSVRFITKQLYPTYEKIGEYLNVDYVPFGFAEAHNDSGEWTYTCQHGPEECYGNKVQSCAIGLFLEKDPAAVTEFLNCAESSNPSDDSALEQCGNEVVSWSDIQDCLNSELGDQFLVANGEKTAAVTPAISYIPTIIFNGVYDETLQDQGEHYFLETACMLLHHKPLNCPTA